MSRPNVRTQNRVLSGSASDAMEFPQPYKKSFSSKSPYSDLERSVLQHLSVIIDPDLKRDIVSLGFVKDIVISSGKVSFNLELTTPACPVKDQFVDACKNVLKQNLDWVTEVQVTLTAQAKKNAGPSGGGLSRISNIIAVSSCKGGVGKSTVAYNLALALRKRNSKVGLLDCDIFGPSLPVFAPKVVKGPLDDKMPQQVQVFLDESTGMKLMSMGYLKPSEGVALRGPMVSGLIQQLLTSTGWGELDYLVLDMPPGTSDIHLTIGQHASIDGAVVVTTPHDLAIVDVEKGIDLLNKMKTPPIALVENFSFFKCNKCDEKHDIFGKSGSALRVAQKYGIDNIVQMPIRNHGADDSFEKLADTVIREISKLKYSTTTVDLTESTEKGFTLTESLPDGSKPFEGTVSYRELRLNCKSATMIDEWTGEKLFKEEDIPQDVKPTKIEKAGNYAYRIDWSDNHHSIFPVKAIKALCIPVHKE
jgi:ATP-binding protein involved in chromosome partitioning